MNQMKSLLVVGFLSCALPALYADTTDTNNSPSQTFFNDVVAWGSSIDTNNTTTFVDSAVLFDTGVESRIGDGISLINDLHMSYDLVGVTTNATSTRFGPELLERNSGVAGTFVSAQGGLQVARVINDFRFGVALDGGYWAKNSSVNQHLFGEFCLDAEKALGSKSHAYTGIRFAQEFPRNAQGVFAKIGITF